MAFDKENMSPIERMTLATRLRVDGVTYAGIAERLGYSGPAAARKAIETLRKRFNEEAQENLQEIREQELRHLSDLKVAALEILRRKHLLVQAGAVVHYDGSPLGDDTSALRAIDTLLRVSKRRSELLGLDAPTVIDTDALRIELVGVDPDVLK